jgi:peptidoglycan/xylan/chitin deacetylase (PgdA/CDA1 family)
MASISSPSRGWLPCLVAALLLGGCATQQVQVETKRETIVAKTDDFMLVRTAQGDTLDSLAETYLQNGALAPRIAEANGIEQLTPGKIVVVPLKTAKRWPVDEDGYQVVPILCYHQFGPGNRARNKMEVSAANFDRQMAYLRDNGYSVITLADLHAYLAGEKMLPPKAVVITIDDGYRSVYDVAFPILKKYGFKATLYTYTDFIGGGMALTWEQMREMEASGYIAVESHSKTHTSMSLNPGESQGVAYHARVQKEVVTPEGVIGEKLGKKVQDFAYPYGDTSPTVLSIMEERGYRTAATVQRGGNPSFADPLVLRRDMVYSDDSMAQFEKYLTVREQIDLR